MWLGPGSQTWSPSGRASFRTQHPGAPTGRGLCGCSATQHTFQRPVCRRLLAQDRTRVATPVVFLQAGEKHYHPLCALCVRCGRMFAEGEEMYLQGKDTDGCSVPGEGHGHVLGPFHELGVNWWVMCYLAA